MSTRRRTLAEIQAHGEIRPVKLSHVVIRTSDMARLRSWYLTVLSARVSYQNELVCFATYDSEHHRIGIVQLPEAAPAPGGAIRAGLEHVSFAYPDLGALLANFRRLKALGIEPFWTINHGPTMSMYYRDPDGNKVELQVDVFDNADEVNDYLARHYPENFMGIIFDPEDLIRRYEAGEPLEDLYLRPALPPGMTPWDMHRP